MFVGHDGSALRESRQIPKLLKNLLALLAVVHKTVITFGVFFLRATIPIFIAMLFLTCRN